jgi:hypothetical protein
MDLISPPFIYSLPTYPINSFIVVLCARNCFPSEQSKINPLRESHLPSNSGVLPVVGFCLWVNPPRLLYRFFFGALTAPDFSSFSSLLLWAKTANQWWENVGKFVPTKNFLAENTRLISSCWRFMLNLKSPGAAVMSMRQLLCANSRE